MAVCQTQSTSTLPILARYALPSREANYSAMSSAARVKRDPSTLSQMLDGHRPVPRELGERIVRECAKATRKPRYAARDLGDAS